MKIFLASDYRDAIKNEVEIKKSLGMKITFQDIAEKIRVPKSYLSRVMNNAANLSSDQLYAICEILEMNKDERDFLLLLLEQERSTHKKRKKELEEKIKAFRDRHLSSKDNLEIAELIQDEDTLLQYYLEPWHQVVHMALLIQEIGKNPLKAADLLGLDKAKLAGLIKNLERMRIIKRNGTRISVIKDDLHLSPDSPVYFSWRNHLRLLAANRMNAISTEKTYSFSAIFTADEATSRQIKVEFLIFLNKIQKKVKQAPSENAYQINFDIFPWTECGR